jgi:hypothetical protein
VALIETGADPDEVGEALGEFSNRLEANRQAYGRLGILLANAGLDLSNPETVPGALRAVLDGRIPLQEAMNLGTAFFSCLSMTVAGVVLKRDRLMGIGQMIAMPLFFASNALYPVSIMPTWLKGLALVNPLSYEVDALRGLLINWPSHIGLDFGVLLGSVIVGVTAASSLVGRLAR